MAMSAVIEGGLVTRTFAPRAASWTAPCCSGCSGRPAPGGSQRTPRSAVEGFFHLHYSS